MSFTFGAASTGVSGNAQNTNIRPTSTSANSGSTGFNFNTAGATAAFNFTASGKSANNTGPAVSSGLSFGTLGSGFNFMPKTTVTTSSFVSSTPATTSGGTAVPSGRPLPNQSVFASLSSNITPATVAASMFSTGGVFGNSFGSTALSGAKPTGSEVFSGAVSTGPPRSINLGMATTTTNSTLNFGSSPLNTAASFGSHLGQGTKGLNFGGASTTSHSGAFNFGSAANTKSGGFSFGSTTNSTQPAGGFNFGNSTIPATNQSSGFSFGTAANSNQGGGLNFGDNANSNLSSGFSSTNKPLALNYGVSATTTVSQVPSLTGFGSNAVSTGLSFGDANSKPTDSLASGGLTTTTQSTGLNFSTPTVTTQSSGFNFGNTTNLSGFGTASTNPTTSNAFSLNFGAANNAPTSNLGTLGSGFGNATSNTSTPAFGASASPGTGFGALATTGTGFGASATSGTGFGASAASGTGFGSFANSGTGFGATASSGTGFGLGGLNFGSASSSGTTSGLGFGSNGSGSVLKGLLCQNSGLAVDKQNTLIPASFASLSTATSTTTSSSLAPGLCYRELEEQLNRWTVELEENEKVFVQQATQVNIWDRMLIVSSHRIKVMNERCSILHVDQQRIEQELDFICSQQKELEESLKPLEESLADFNEQSYLQHADLEREHIYKSTETIDAQLKRMGQDLTEIIEHVNACGTQPIAQNPIQQIASILNAHLDSLQWIQNNSAIVQRKMDDVSRSLDIHRRERERSMRIPYRL